MQYARTPPMKSLCRSVRLFFAAVLLIVLQFWLPVRGESQERPVLLYSRYFNAKGDTRYLPEGSYKDVLERLQDTFEVRVHDRPLTAKTLKGVSLLLIVNPNAEAVADGPPPHHCSAKDVATLTQYVRNGGGLMILGNQDKHNLETEKLNKLLAKFGIQFVNEYTDAKRLILPPNALLLGGQRWAFYGGNSLTVQEDHSAAPRAIVTNDLAQPPAAGTRDYAGVLMAGAQLGNGRILVATDAGWLTNDALSGKGIGGVAITDHMNWEIVERLTAWLINGSSRVLDL